MPPGFSIPESASFRLSLRRSVKSSPGRLRRAFFEQIGLFSKLQINFSVTRDPTEEAAIMVQKSFLKVLQGVIPPDDPRVDRKEV